MFVFGKFRILLKTKFVIGTQRVNNKKYFMELLKKFCLQEKITPFLPMTEKN